eukprot:TRINITY_DN32973_c0_g1_i4.p1 TRINITY_DN32973_c0_g1~~TRINITY_DN32973_c0_g1_i4.p1  ORF type:complete len:620 (+),score=110.94 TRINITY_DN32973_c0_g1_i4:1765-3624(+)
MAEVAMTQTLRSGSTGYARQTSAGPADGVRLWCVFAEGVELAKLSEQERAIAFPARGGELVVGRTAQPTVFWDTLVPDRRFHGTVSREHFKVVRKGNSGEYSLNCMSLNGLLLNAEFIKQDSGERRLQHGDVISFAATLDATSQDRNQATARKRFVAFSVEVGAAPANQPAAAGRDQRPTAVPSVPKMTTPPPAAVPVATAATPAPEAFEVGRWKNDGLPAVDRKLFYLEVQGNGVRMDLPAEDRQLCLTSGGSSSSTAAAPKALRVGHQNQRGFWQRVLQPSFLTGEFPSALGGDHFEVRSARRPPAAASKGDWRFSMRVLSSAGLFLNNSSAVCGAGDERELQPRDVLSLAGTITGGGSSSSSSKALQFKFMLPPAEGQAPARPVATSPSAAEMAAPGSTRRMLPELRGGVFDEPDEGLVMERSSITGMPSGGGRQGGAIAGRHVVGDLQAAGIASDRCGASALRPPVGLPAQSDDADESPAADGGPQSVTPPRPLASVDPTLPAGSIRAAVDSAFAAAAASSTAPVRSLGAAASVPASSPTHFAVPGARPAEPGDDLFARSGFLGASTPMGSQRLQQPPQPRRDMPMSAPGEEGDGPPDGSASFWPSQWMGKWPPF